MPGVFDKCDNMPWKDRGTFDKFDNLPEDYVPNNEPRCFHEHHLDIMTGETVVHSFEIPFNARDDTSDIHLIYKMGDEIILDKGKDELNIDFLGESGDLGPSLITCELSSTESALFTSEVLNTRVQFKFTMNSGSIMYSEIYKVRVKNSLKAD